MVPLAPPRRQPGSRHRAEPAVFSRHSEPVRDGRSAALGQGRGLRPNHRRRYDTESVGEEVNCIGKGGTGAGARFFPKPLLQFDKPDR